MFRSYRLPLVFIVVLLALAVVACAGAPAAAPVAVQPSPTAAQTAMAALTEPSAPSPVATDSSSAPTSTTAAATTSSTSGSSNDLVTLVVVPDKSEARYRVREQLARLSAPSDAIGRTNAIAGQIVGHLDGTIDSTQSKFTVDVSKLQSDQGMRDNFLRRNTLESAQYPTATFVPKTAQGLPNPIPTTGGSATFKLIGDLTIRNVTKEVTWDVSCQGQGNEGTCHATTTFPFEYFNLSQPSVAVVLSVENKITLELDLTLQRASAS